MTDEEITLAALSDPDNPPLTGEEFARMVPANFVRRVRAGTGLSQAKFAERYRINHARLRDLEQGRGAPDSALVAYLEVIAREPEAVGRALDASGGR
jgi:putative transcriptional regulator